MKGSLFPRFFGLLLLYFVVFILLVLAQFSRQSSFAMSLGSLDVSGNYLDKEGGNSLDGGVRAFFGGVEFSLSEAEGFEIIHYDDTVKVVDPEAITVSDKEIMFSFDEGGSLAFSSLFVGGSELLRIKGSFTEDQKEFRLPFKPLKSSRIVQGDGEYFVVKSDGSDYAFAGSPVDVEKQQITLKPVLPIISYGLIAPATVIHPDDFILPAAMKREEYEKNLKAWQDKVWIQWKREIASSPDEDTVNAYIAESARRNNYRSALASIPGSFQSDSKKSYRTSPYFGSLDAALRSLSQGEREYLSRISRLANDDSVELLGESKLFSSLVLRGQFKLAEEVASLVRSLDPSLIRSDSSVGILEGYREWQAGPFTGSNPFERLLDQAHFVLLGMIRKSATDTVFVFPADLGDTALSLRFGMALASMEKDTAGDWASLGRTLILSVLALSDQDGNVPAYVRLSVDGVVSPDGSQRLKASQIYKMVVSGAFYPRSIGVDVSGSPGVWAWTAAEGISASYTGSVLDVAVDFPVGETHYMMIRGIKPFNKIQLYGIDFRTDPRFERYDSSGWAYSSSEQTLLLKMKHRSRTEYVRIFY